MLKKIIRNNSEETIQILNKSVACGDSYDIPVNQWNKLYDDSVIKDLLLSGDLILNDGNSDLNYSDALELVYKFQETDFSNINIIGLSDSYYFTKNGSVGNEFLDYGYGQNSHNTPAPIKFNCTLFGMTFSNRDSYSDIDLKIYKNGEVYYTWEIRDKKYAYKTNLPSLDFEPGDLLKVYASTIASNKKPNEVTLHILLKITSTSIGEGGGN